MNAILKRFFLPKVTTKPNGDVIYRFGNDCLSWKFLHQGGMTLIGQTGSGKSSTFAMLARARGVPMIVGLGGLHEKLTGLQLAGVGILLLGILAVALPQAGGRATLPALLTGVAIASYTAVDRVGVRLSTPWLYGWLLVVVLAIAIPVSMWVAARERKSNVRSAAARSG